jgi:hypothetical protein
VNKKPPTKGDKTPTREERNLHFSKLPKMKYRKGGRESFEKIKEREEMKQKGRKKKKRGLGAQQPWRLPQSRW